MKDFTFYSPTLFRFGMDSQSDTGELVKKFGGKRVLIHYGGGSVIKNGILDQIKKSLDHEGLFYTELGGAQPNPVDTLVYKGIETGKKDHIDFILAVGGGSTIDSAKAIAAGMLYEGDFWDFLEGAPVDRAIPIGVVLTISAAGSEGSPNFVITRQEGLLKRGTKSDVLRPVFSILNPMFTTTLPAYQTASGGTDIMAHVFERYFTNTKDVEVTDRLCEAVLLTMVRELPRAIADPENYEARANIMWAGMLAHNDICGVGRDQDWGSHWLEHELSALYDCAHGAGLAVIIPAWMQYVMHHDVMRFAQLAVRVFGVDMDFNHPENTAAEGIRRVKAFFSSLGMPVTFRELGAREEDIPILVEKIKVNPDGTLGTFLKIDKKGATEIYRLAL